MPAPGSDRARTADRARRAAGAPARRRPARTRRRRARRDPGHAVGKAVDRERDGERQEGGAGEPRQGEGADAARGAVGERNKPEGCDHQHGQGDPDNLRWHTDDQNGNQQPSGDERTPEGGEGVACGHVGESLAVAQEDDRPARKCTFREGVDHGNRREQPKCWRGARLRRRRFVRGHGRHRPRQSDEQGGDRCDCAGRSETYRKYGPCPRGDEWPGDQRAGCEPEPD